MMKLLPLAFRSLLRNKRRSFFTLLAIVVGVAVAIFVNGFGYGLTELMVMQTVNSRIGAIQIHRAGYLKANEAAPLKLDMPATGELHEQVRTTPGVKAVARRIRFGATLSNGTAGTTVMGQALEVDKEFEVCPERRDEVRELGRHLSAQHPRGAVLGGELANSFGVKPGDTMMLSAPGREGAVNALDIDVIGVTRGAVTLENKRLASVPLAYAQDLLQMEGRITELVVAVTDIKKLDEVAAEMRRRVGPEYEVSTWDEVMPFLKDAVGRLTNMVDGLTFTLVVIIMFGIINTMLMSVYERVREIGMMLALGMRRRQILALFLMEAFALGVVGGGLGTLIGFSVTFYLHATGILMSPVGSAFKQLIRPSANPKIAVLAVVVSLAGALIAAAWPARRASRMNPVDALRTV